MSKHSKQNLKNILKVTQKMKTNLGEYLTKFQAYDMKWIMASLSDMHEYITAPNENIVLKLNCFFALKIFLDSGNNVLATLIQIYFIDQLMEAAKFQANDRKSENRGCNYFIQQGYSKQIPQIGQFGRNYVKIAEQIITVMGNIKPNKLYIDKPYKESSNWAIFAKKLLAMGDEKIEYYFYKENILEKIKQKYKTNRNVFYRASQPYSHFFKQQTKYLIENNLKSRTKLQIFKILEYDDALATPEVIDTCMETLESNRQLRVRTNTLKILDLLMSMGDVEVYTVLINEGVLENIMLQVIKGPQSRDLIRGRKLFPTIKAKQQQKQQFYEQFLKCIHKWSLFYPLGIIHKQRDTKIKAIRDELRFKHELKFPDDSYIKKQLAQFQINKKKKKNYNDIVLAQLKFEEKEYNIPTIEIQRIVIKLFQGMNEQNWNQCFKSIKLLTNKLLTDDSQIDECVSQLMKFQTHSEQCLQSSDLSNFDQVMDKVYENLNFLQILFKEIKCYQNKEISYSKFVQNIQKTEVNIEAKKSHLQDIPSLGVLSKNPNRSQNPLHLKIQSSRSIEDNYKKIQVGQQCQQPKPQVKIEGKQQGLFNSPNYDDNNKDQNKNGQWKIDLKQIQKSSNNKQFQQLLEKNTQQKSQLQIKDQKKQYQQKQRQQQKMNKEKQSRQLKKQDSLSNQSSLHIQQQNNIDYQVQSQHYQKFDQNQFQSKLNKQQQQTIYKDKIIESELKPLDESYCSIGEQVNVQQISTFKQCFIADEHYLRDEPKNKLFWMGIHTTGLIRPASSSYKTFGSQISQNVSDQTSIMELLFQNNKKTERQMKKLEEHKNIKIQELTQTIELLTKKAHNMEQQIFNRSHQSNSNFINAPKYHRNQYYEQQQKLLQSPNRYYKKRNHLQPSPLKPFRAYLQPIGKLIEMVSYKHYFQELGDEKSRKILLKNKCLLHKDNNIQIGVMSRRQNYQNRLQITLYVSSEMLLEDLQVKIVQSQLDISLKPETIKRIQPKKQERILFTISIKEIPFELPNIEVQYKMNGNYDKKQLVLPCTFSKFFHIRQVSESNINDAFERYKQKIIRSEEVPYSKRILQRYQQLTDYFSNIGALMNGEVNSAGEIIYGGQAMYIICIKPNEFLYVQALPQKQYSTNHIKIMEFYVGIISSLLMKDIKPANIKL